MLAARAVLMVAVMIAIIMLVMVLMIVLVLRHDVLRQMRADTIPPRCRQVEGAQTCLRRVIPLDLVPQPRLRFIRA